MSSFVTCFWEDVNIKGCVRQDKLAQLLSLPPFQAVSLCFCSIYLCFYLAFMIFVHPAESRAQPSARAASRRIGQKSCSQTGLNLIGHNGDEVKSRLVKLPSGLSLIGWCLEEVAVEYSRFFWRMGLFTKTLVPLWDSGDSEGTFWGRGGERFTSLQSWGLGGRIN